MALQLHAKCKERLAEALSAALANVKIQYGEQIQFFCTPELFSIDKILPKDSEFRDQITSYVEEQAFFEFVFQTLAQELPRKLEDELGAKKEPIPLIRIGQYGDLRAASQRLVDLFDSLPWKYRLSFNLPWTVSGLLGEL